MNKLKALALASMMTIALTACHALESTSNDVTADSPFVPQQSINWVCTSSPGGVSDRFTRTLAELMTQQNLVNGQTIAPSNQTENSGQAGRRKVSAITGPEADHTLLTFNSGDMTAMITNTKLRVDDFRILGIMAMDKQILLSCPGCPAKTDYAKGGNCRTDLAQAIEAAKSGTFVSIAGSRNDDYIIYRRLLEEAGLAESQMGYIAYDSSADAITAALRGNVDFVIAKPAIATEYVESGDLVGIVALAKKNFPGSLADVPTLSELSDGEYADIEFPVWRGVAAPAAMSDEAVAFWSDALDQIADSDAWRKDYLEKNLMQEKHLSTDRATAYAARFQAAFMAENGLGE